MAWRSSGTSNAGAFVFSAFANTSVKLELVGNLHRHGIITSDRVRRAMLAVDRALYWPARPYQDAPQPIGFNATISAPHMHAHALNILEPYIQETSHVLDVGSGTGILVAMFSQLAPRGVSVGIEHVEQLVHSSRDNLARDQSLQGHTGVQVVLGDGRLGYPDKAPYDAIHVGAAAYPVPPALLDQLAPGGCLLLPVGLAGGDQSMRKIVKKRDGSGFQQEDLFGVRYVPLTSREEQGF